MRVTFLQSVYCPYLPKFGQNNKLSDVVAWVHSQLAWEQSFRKMNWHELEKWIEQEGKQNDWNDSMN